MNNNSEQKVTARQRLICNITAGALIVICGFVLLLSGLGAIPLEVGDIALPSVLFCFGLTFVVTAIVQKNSVSLWLSFFCNMPATIVLLVACSDFFTYSNAYPFFVSVPAFASLFTMLISKKYRFHITSAAFFLVLAALFCLESFSVAGWGVVIPCIVIFIGAIILANVLLKNWRKHD